MNTPFPKLPKELWQQFILRIRQLQTTFQLQFPLRVIIGVSGGPDSIFLTYLMAKLKLIGKLEPIVVYIDHKVRSKKEVKKEIKVIENLTTKFGLPFVLEELPLKKRKQYDENTLRKLRYEKFFSLAKKYKCDFIALGHTRDDVVETVLMNFFRGSGVKGFCGIPFFREIYSQNVSKRKVFVFRPIIDIPKQKIIEFLNKNNIKYVVDKTNLTLNYTRNFVRNKLIPVIKSIYPNFEFNILNTVEIMSSLERYISDSVTQILKKILLKKTDTQAKLDFKKFLMYNTYIQTEILYRILSDLAEKKHILLKSGYKPLVDKILQFVSLKNNFSLKIKKRLQLTKDKNSLIIKYT